MPQDLVRGERSSKAVAVAGSSLPYPQHLDPRTREAMQHMLDAVEAFREVHPTAPLHLLTAFLRVAIDEGKGVKDYADEAKVASTVMSRHLLDLGSRLRTAAPGLGLLEANEDPDDIRRYRMALTHKGFNLILRMANRLGLNKMNGRKHDNVSRKA